MELSPSDILKAELINALKNHEFVLYYQPQYNLVTTRCEGVEALIRWHHPVRGLLYPDEFIPIAEKSEIISRIGEWVLRTSCLQARTWLDKGFPNLRMAVNVSGRQLRNHKFIDLIRDLLQEYSLKPESLELELNENIIFHNDDKKIIQALERLHEMGVQIALDDFGTGFSSISYLKKIPIDRIKIDKSFIDKIHTNNDDAAIVKAIITLAMTLKIQVIAEGVETLKQLQTLTANEGVGVQGFYISQALPVEEVEKFLLLYQNA